MAINSDIRDHAYQFFTEEAPELLQILEAGLLTLRQEKSTVKVHDLMRAAHSLKGGAASVGLDAIETLAHRLETIFKALYCDLQIDTELESQLLQAYDCLHLPLNEQITVGYFDAEQALAQAEPIFTRIEERLGDALNQTDIYIPSSTELGVDMALSIFDVDVGQGLERLAAIAAHPQDYEVAGELRAQAEVFSGFAELLNQPEFGAIAQTTLIALNAHPECALEIMQLAIADFGRCRQVVIAGEPTQQVSPSVALVALANSQGTALKITAGVGLEENSSVENTQTTAQEELEENSLLSLEEIINSAIAPQSATDAPEVPVIVDVEGLTEATDGSEESLGEAPSLEEIFGGIFAAFETETNAELGNGEDVAHAVEELPSRSAQTPIADKPETLELAVQSIEQIFDSLPLIEEFATQNSSLDLAPVQVSSSLQGKGSLSQDQIAFPIKEAGAFELNPTDKEPKPTRTSIRQNDAPVTSNLTVRVDSERLERMNNLVGELAINRNGLSLQNEQLQGSVRELLNRFTGIQNLVGKLRQSSDQMVVGASSSRLIASHPSFLVASGVNGQGSVEKTKIRDKETPSQSHFDSLELDSYGALHSQLQGLLEDMMQLEEAVDDIALFARATDQTLEQQRQNLTQLRDELRWARMLPLGEILNRFPRVLRDLSTTYNKPVSLKLSGTGVLVDKAILEKLYDPLLHLLRNAFDHGIESSEIRRQKGKPEHGQIEIRAYHKGSQTIIEVHDDGQGLNWERIRQRALELDWLSAEQLAQTADSRLSELIFEPGFSTASQLSELSGRGVGLDVVRLQLRSLKGTVTVTSTPGQGTTFTLKLPLTLTIANLLICLVGSTALALPADSIEEIVIPKANQIQQSGVQRFLSWQEQIVPTYRLADLLDYACPLPETPPSKALVGTIYPEDWQKPMLMLRLGTQVFALEIERLVTEQELVIKSFGEAIAPPSFTYGCTILGDGSLVPVIDTTSLLETVVGQSTARGAVNNRLEPQHSIAIANLEEVPVSVTLQHAYQNPSPHKTTPALKTAQAPTVLVVDDAVALRRTLALTLERAGFRVLQAPDGREAMKQLQHSAVELVVCDIEMPNMNGFEFLGTRRQDSQLATIPVLMLTSRSNDKHRRLAMQLGAAAYFTKPYIEQEFLKAIKEIMSQQTNGKG